METEVTTTGTPGQVYLPLLENDTATAVSVIVKLRGETCDIDCVFCYEKRKESPGGARVEVADIARLTDIFGDRPLVIELHGGEPLTAGKRYVREVLTTLATLPTVVRVTMQTNAVRLDDEWLDLFDEAYPGLHLGVSLDGDPQGNAWRIGYDGSPTYDRVAAALRLLADRGRKVGIITVVTPRVLGRAAAVLEHLAGFSAVNAVSFVPCFDSGVRAATAVSTSRTPVSRTVQQNGISANGPAWAITGDEYAAFVLDAASHWVRSGLSARIKLEPVVSTIRTLKGLDTGFCHFSNLKCDHVFTLYPDAGIGSCDELPWPAARLGRVSDFPGENEIATAQRALPLLVEGRTVTTKCETCRYRQTCGGGCIATRLRSIRAVGDDQDYCRYRMRLVDGVAALITQPETPTALSCGTVRARPHQPNAMTDVAGFLRRWRDPRADRPVVRINTSAHGNINTTGSPGIHEADDLDPLHPAWREAIEPGIWPLVDPLTRLWGLVTYDSCQGHAYEGLALAPAERRVGILPRDRGEYASIAAALCRVVTASSCGLPKSVRVVVGRAELTCTTTGDLFPVLDLRLERSEHADWPTYFAAVDEVCATIADHLSIHRPDQRTTCTCAPRITERTTR
ncbi:radical SAM/SPASM domain-containing protein [Nocardia shimofusensis]|uniref:radical SAM/SPASM domain-containing protein n=1 Tax=Nocardia shimofusensis TaxID=228596 RepID=UPI000837476B|nr:radical SAM protein [Nocardia shimofusensis]